jgi:hypothetical protein
LNNPNTRKGYDSPIDNDYIAKEHHAQKLEEQYVKDGGPFSKAAGKTLTKKRFTSLQQIWT